MDSLTLKIQGLATLNLADHYNRKQVHEMICGDILRTVESYFTNKTCTPSV